MRIRSLAAAAALLLAPSLVACGDDTNGTPTADVAPDQGGDTTTGDVGDDTAEEDTAQPDAGPDTGPDVTPDVVPDEGPQPTDKLICPELTECVVEACGANVTQACLGTALGPNGACEPASNTEATLWQAMLTCQNGCVDGNALDFTCVEANCLDEISACNAGGTFGSGGCIGIVQCQQACGQAPTAECIRNCYSSASQQANIQLQRVELCLQDACSDVPQAQIQACIGDALGAECADVLNVCQTGIEPQPDPDPEMEPDAGPTDVIEDVEEEVIEDVVEEDTATEDTTTEDTATEDTATEDTATGDAIETDVGPEPEGAQGFAPQFRGGKAFYMYIPAY